MARYKIDSVQCETCGAFGNVVLAEAKVCFTPGKPFYMSLAEVDGIPNFFKSPVSTFELQKSGEIDEARAEELRSYSVDVCDYSEVFENPEAEWYSLYRYLIYIVRSDWEACKAFMDATAGKYLDQIEIPLSDAEEEYRAEYGEDPDDESGEEE